MEVATLNALLAASSNKAQGPLMTFNWNPATQLTHYLAAPTL
jgi:hypothetical protein